VHCYLIGKVIHHVMHLNFYRAAILRITRVFLSMAHAGRNNAAYQDPQSNLLHCE
jgi:hypothetical protein